MHPAGCFVELPDHESLSRLASENSPAFEALRQQLIEAWINGAPKQKQARLRGLQFRVDAIRRLTHSPLGATVKIYALMWRSFLELNEQLQDFVELAGPHNVYRAPAIAENRPRRLAKVIAFRPHQIAPKMTEAPI